MAAWPRYVAVWCRDATSQSAILAVLQTAGQRPAVGAEGHAMQGIVVPQNGELAPRRRVPEPDGRVAAGRGECLAVGGKATLSIAMVSLQDGAALANVSASTSVIAPRQIRRHRGDGQQLAVGRIGQARHRLRLRGAFARGFQAPDLPEGDDLVRARCRQGLAVGRERQRSDPLGGTSKRGHQPAVLTSHTLIGLLSPPVARSVPSGEKAPQPSAARVAFERGDEPARGGLVELHGPVAAARDQQRAVGGVEDVPRFGLVDRQGDARGQLVDRLRSRA